MIFTKMESVAQEFMIDVDNEIPENIPQPIINKLKCLETIIQDIELWTEITNVPVNDEAFKQYLSTKDKDTCANLLKFAISCLQHFVQVNFTGPNLQKDIADFLDGDNLKRSDFCTYLSSGDEELNSNTKSGVLLAVARLILKNISERHLYVNWWFLRCILTHQNVLEEPSLRLWNEIIELETIFEDNAFIGYEKARLELEFAQLYLLYRNISKAQPHIKAAGDVLGLEYELVGLLGKRTKYQLEEKAQLSLVTRLSHKDEIIREPVKLLAVPTNVSLNDDVRLEKIEYTNKELLGENDALPSIEQQFLILIIKEMMISKPQDELYVEEMEPYITSLLGQNSTWVVRVLTLLARCKLEMNKSKTIERSLQQCEELVHSFKNEKPLVVNRIGGVYSAGLPPIWNIEGLYADLMFKLGLVKAALDVYLKLQMWEEVIGCYTTLNLKHKAAEIIKQQMEVKPSPKLWCWLGDATDDVSCYEKAWIMSEEKSFRAQRHWGAYYYHKKQYQDCIPHYEKSVSINPLQPLVWLRMAYSALQTEQWECAATSYKYYTTLEPDNFEAWNNLAQAHIKLGNKRSAHQALLDAIRCNFDNWKVWENLLMVSAAIAHFSDVIRAYHRLLDLKEKYLNLEVLSVLVHGVSNDIKDPEGRSTVHLIGKCRELLGRISSVHPGDGGVWELYASVSPDSNTRAQRLQRAYRGYVKMNNWNKEVDCCKRVLHVCLKLGEVVLRDDIEAKDPLVASARMNLSSAISAIKKQSYEETQQMIVECNESFEKITMKCKSALQ